MTGPDPDVHVDDFDDPEDFAEAVGVDPTAEQVDEYRAETAGTDKPSGGQETGV